MMDSKFFSDLYDKQTVAQCRLLIKSLQAALDKTLEDSKDQKTDIHRAHIAKNVAMYFLTGERALKKEEWVREKMREEERKEKIVREAKFWKDVLCQSCYSIMEVSSKDLESREGKKDRVLMIYHCPRKCLPGRAFYDDGQEYFSKPIPCSKCKSDTNTDHERDGKIITTTHACTTCGNVDTETLDLTPHTATSPVVDEDFEADRRECCLSPAATEKYRAEGIFRHDWSWMKEIAEKDGASQPAPGAEVPIRMLKVAEMHQIVTKALEGCSFTKVDIGAPTNARDIRVKITALDTLPNREDWVAENAAKAALKEALKDTNWRLIRGSLQVPLGALIGELKGATSEVEAKSLKRAEKLEDSDESAK